MSKCGLVVSCGPMFCGKSEELIRRLRRAVIAKLKVVAFKHSADDRYSADDKIVTHQKQTFPSIRVNAISQMEQHITEDTNVIGIDEVQFFDTKIVSAVEMWANQGIQVIVAGLDQDYRGKPFGPMPFLLARADKILKLNAVCMVCGEKATKTLIIGSTEKYEARCRACWNKGYEGVKLPE